MANEFSFTQEKGLRPIRRVAIYARVSTDCREGNASLDDQVQECLRIAGDNRWEIVVEPIRETASGRDDDRPGLRRLFELAESGAIDAVLTAKADRLTRADVVDQLVMEQEFGKLGVTLVSPDLPTGDNETTDLLRTLIRVFENHERRRIASLKKRRKGVAE